jgi:serine O-acetyltransferase
LTLYDSYILLAWRSEEMREVQGLILAALYECCPPHLIKFILDADRLLQAKSLIGGDVHAYLQKDPAAGNDIQYIIHAASSFKAVLHFRLASALLKMAHGSLGACAEGLRNTASLLSCRGKLLSGAEIHYRAQIGPRFVLDHGFGTVIGETTEIGEDCYVLGSVTLGAVGIAENASAKRHPIIGNRVQIGAFSRILGPVRIGDDTFIGSHCTITEDIPHQSRVTIKSTHQITRSVADKGDLSTVTSLRL